MPNPRVVIIHTGGLRRIIGEFNPEEHQIYPEIDLPKFVQVAGPRCAKARLVSATPKVIIYREIE